MSKSGWLVAGFFAFVTAVALGENLPVFLVLALMVALPVMLIRRANSAQKMRERVRQESIAEAQRKLDKARADQQNLLREIHGKYQQALLDLEAKPTDIDRRKAALVAGRTYAEVARRMSGQSGRTMFDETEIQNDIAIRIGNSQVVAAAKRSHKCPNCAAPLVHEAKVCRFCDAPVHA